ncbi:MAG: ATP-binding protein, partial [Acidobacteriota bacterium]|nr:ATP-binding protein [Acidobacteriota bacterium]
AEMVVVRLNEIVKEAIAFTEDYARASQDERGARVRFNTELAGNLPPVRADKGELRRVFVNLLRNAIDAIAGESRITVRTWADDAKAFAEVRYTDERMSEEVQGELFRTPFVSNGEREANQRVATCYAIVRHHGGDIEVKSTLNEGTTFTVKLPLV